MADDSGESGRSPPFDEIEVVYRPQRGREAIRLRAKIRPGEDPRLMVEDLRAQVRRFFDDPPWSVYALALELTDREYGAAVGMAELDRQARVLLHEHSEARPDEGEVTRDRRIALIRSHYIEIERLRRQLEDDAKDPDLDTARRLLGRKSPFPLSPKLPLQEVCPEALDRPRTPVDPDVEDDIPF